MFSLGEGWIFLQLPSKLDHPLYLLQLVLVMVTLLVHDRLLQVVHAGTLFRDTLWQRLQAWRATVSLRLHWLWNKWATHHLKFEVINSLSFGGGAEARCRWAVLINSVIVPASASMDMHIQMAIVVMVWGGGPVRRVENLIVFMLLFVFKCSFTPISLMLIKMRSLNNNLLPRTSMPLIPLVALQTSLK